MRRGPILLAGTLAVASLVAVQGRAGAGTGGGTASQVAADVKSSLSIKTLPSNLSPPVQDASTDTAYVDTPSLSNCNTTGITIAFAKCIFGDPKGKHTMVLWGDSHAFMWFPAVNAVAKANHWRLVALMKFGCPDADVAVWNPLTKAPYTTCTTFRRNMIAHIDSLRPQLVILTEAFTALGATGNGANSITTSAWQSALKKTLSLLHGSGMKKLVLGSTIAAGTAEPSPVPGGEPGHGPAVHHRRHGGAALGAECRVCGREGRQGDLRERPAVAVLVRGEPDGLQHRDR